MTFIDPRLHSRFALLPTDIKNSILEKNLKINTLDDLNKCIEDVKVQN